MMNLLLRDDATQFVKALNDLGIKISREGDEIVCAAPAGALTSDIADQIREHKVAILELLRSSRSDGARKLRKVEDRECYPASSQQKRLFALQQLDTDGIAYNISSAYILNLEVDIEELQSAVNAVIARHEALRTRFEVSDGKVVQRIEDTVSLQVKFEAVSEEEVADRVSTFARPFDLRASPLLRVTVLRKPDGVCILLMDIHHIISDGVSNAILIEDFARAFRGEVLEPQSLQYKDYSVWQQEGEGRELLERQGAYWRERFEGEVSLLEMPTDFVRPKIRDYRGARYKTDLGIEDTAALFDYCRDSKVTLYMILLASYGALLARYSGQEDVVVGNVVAGRDSKDLEGILGMFVNTLALRIYPEGGKRFVDYLYEVKQVCLDALENQQYPFEELLQSLNLERDTSRNPLFDVTLVLQNFERSSNIEGLGPMRSYALQRSVAKFDMALTVTESSEGLGVSVEYATSLFRRSTILRLAGHFKRVVESVVEDSNRLIRDIDILDTVEKDRLLCEFNATETDYPLDRRVHELFEDQARRVPEAIAVAYGGEQLTYRELDERSNGLAWLLREKYGVGENALIGLCLERSFEMIIGILGILKAGGAYLPIDPSYPADRIRFMLEDGAVETLLVKGLLPREVAFRGATLDLDVVCRARRSGSLAIPGSSSDLAYVIYTSGSTGRPKGVMCEHAGLVNRLLWMRGEYDVGEADHILQKTTYAFDVSVWELLLPGLSGARLCLLELGGEGDPAAIDRAVEDFGITMMHFVPSMLSAYLRWLPEGRRYSRLRRIICSGESLSTSHRDLFFEKFGDSVELHNLYGPTEASIDVSFWRVGCSGDRIPIGRPVANTHLYVLDASGALVPLGANGELNIGGAQLARGYLNRVDLTSEKFVSNRFEPEKRMYRTGDLVRWLSDGILEFSGRVDGQVKIRGFRIELEEIEMAISNVDGVRESVVVSRNLNGQPTIVAYYATNREVGITSLRDKIKEQLPAYMIPSCFMKLAEIPHTASGKLDRKALPEPDSDSGGISDYVAPHSTIEIAMAQIWSEVLKKDRIGVNDYFFDLGGDSLSAIECASKIEKQIGVEVSLLRIMDDSLGELSRYCSQNRPPSRGLSSWLGRIKGIFKI